MPESKSRGWHRRAKTFLIDVWSQHTEGFVFVAARDAENGQWSEEYLRVGDSPLIKEFLLDHLRSKYDLYFCPNAFEKPKRKKQYGQSTCFAWCDIDEADPKNFDPKASILWRTSPDRHQGLWLFDQQISRERAEEISRALAYRYGGDKTGWSITKYLRIPHTFNHKPAYDTPTVRIEHEDWEPLPRVPKIFCARPISDVPDDEDQEPLSPLALKEEPHRVFRRYRKKLHLMVRQLIRDKRVSRRDRSKRIYQIIVGLAEAGASKDEIASVVWHNVYFRSKHGENRRALEEEISRILSKWQKQK